MRKLITALLTGWCAPAPVAHTDEPKILFPDHPDRPPNAPWHWQKWPDGNACRFQSRALQGLIASGQLTWEGMCELADEDMDSYEVHIKIGGYERDKCHDAARAITNNKRLTCDWMCHTVAGTDTVNTFWVTVKNENVFTIILHCVGFGMTRTKGVTADAFSTINRTIGWPMHPQFVSADIVKHEPA